MTPVLPNSGEAAKTAFPSDDMIVLAALLEGGEWREAEDIASTLRRLGFVISPQKMAGQFRRLLVEDAPMFERRLSWTGTTHEYRVTRYGHNQLNGDFPKTFALTRPNTRGGAQ